MRESQLDWRVSRERREAAIFQRLRTQRSLGVISGSDSDLARRAYDEACESTRRAIAEYNDRCDKPGRQKRNEAC